VFGFEAERWRHQQGDFGGYFVARPSWLQLVRDDGSGPRIARGDAIFGHRGDRLLLVRRLRQTDCTTTEGSFVVLDQKTRLWLDVGPLGGLDRPVYRHAQGLGFRVGDPAPGVPAHEIGLARDVIAARPVTVASAGYSERPDAGDAAATIALPGPPCRRAAKHDLARLPRARGEPPFVGRAAIDRWISCDTGKGGSVLLSGPASCPGGWGVYSLDRAGRLVDHAWSKTPDARGPRAASIAGRLVIELDRRGGDEAELWGVDDRGKLVLLEQGVGFSAPWPGACACSGSAAPGSP
jgi:hypothetical protein